MRNIEGVVKGRVWRHSGESIVLCTGTKVWWRVTDRITVRWELGIGDRVRRANMRLLSR